VSANPNFPGISGTAHSQSEPQSDDELITLFQQDSEQAWRFFIDRYADTIFSLLRSLGFDYDKAMDRFVYVCDKLCEKDFRRLKSIKYAGRHGDLSPWLRQVVKRLCINWAWSEDGRRRLLKPIQAMGRREQRVFELYFWQGLSPIAIEERLQFEHFENTNLANVFEALDQILAALSEKKLWRLISTLTRGRELISLDERDEETGLAIDPPDFRPDPEHELIQREQSERLRDALLSLPGKQPLLLQFRFEHGLSTKEIAGMLGMEQGVVSREVRAGIKNLRKTLS
jgi:DNA-directed RNA polymerase specialized sigma subunit